MSEVFGYGIAHKHTGKRLLSTGRKAYDGRAAASSALNCMKSSWNKHDEDYRQSFHMGQDPHEFVVVELVSLGPVL